MDELHSLGTFYAPVGNRRSQFQVSRRSFIGAVAGISALPLLMRAPTADAAIKKSRPCAPSLRFDEDKLRQELIITWYPELEVDPSPLTDDQPRCVASTLKDKARSWRLVGKAFGPKAQFQLRWLSSSPFTYRLDVVKARFGEMDEATHQFTFTHLLPEKTWKVQLETFLWGRRQRSKQLDFRNISSTTDLEKDQSKLDFTAYPEGSPEDLAGFQIEVDAGDLRDSLRKIFGDHLQLTGGKFVLVLEPNGVWRLVPTSSDTARQILLAEGALAAPRGLGMAWCELNQEANAESPPVNEASDGIPSGNAGKAKVDVSGRKLPKPTPTDPVFLAWAQASEGAVDLGKGKAPCAKLSARSIIRREAELAKPTTDLSVDAPASLQAQTGVPQKPGFTAPQWRYERHDWAFKDGRHPEGASSIQAAWEVWVTVAPGKPAFGPLLVEEGVLKRSKAGNPGLRFAARLRAEPWWLTTCIGGLFVHGRTQEASETGAVAVNDRTHRTLMTLASAGYAAPLSSLDVPLLLRRCDLAPVDCEFSDFRFAATSLRAVYHNDAAQARADLLASSSYLWLGAPETIGDLPTAHIDLTRARIELARTRDLARLAFLFSGLHLDIGGSKAWITDTRASCRVRQRIEPGRVGSASALGEQVVPDDPDDATHPIILDSRPVLVVEFSPQHVFEEAIFRPGPAPLPDVALKASCFAVDVPLQGNPRQFSTALPQLLRELEALDDDAEVREARNTETLSELKSRIRSTYADMKIKTQAQTDPRGQEDQPFEAFSKQFKLEFEAVLALQDVSKAERWPLEEKIYIGAVGLRPEIAALARRVQVAMSRSAIASSLDATLHRAAHLIDLLKGAQPQLDSTWQKLLRKLQEAGLLDDPLNHPGGPLSDRDRARLVEQMAGAIMQDYAYFRDFYSEWMLRQKNPLQLRADDLEFFSPTNRYKLDFKDAKEVNSRFEAAKAAYVERLRSAEPPPTIMRARLSGSSRLAFHVDCGSRPGVDVEEGDAHSVAPPAGTRLPFSFDALTDWAHYDLAVTPRARQAPVFDDGGALVRRNAGDSAGIEDDSTSADVAMLRSLGIRSGQTSDGYQRPGRMRDWGSKPLRTLQERLSDVESSLTVIPTNLQTSIELPARLILSPSQKAQWNTRRAKVPWPVVACNAVVPLWTASLDVRTNNPLVRAVASPDLRPEFVRFALDRTMYTAQKAAAAPSSDKPKALHAPTGGAPPRGPRAPWTIGFEESDPNTSSIVDLFEVTRPPGAPALLETDICNLPVVQKPGAMEIEVAPGSAQDLHPLVRYLCERKQARNQYAEHAIFRSTMDAYDRHEIVLLSSAWGLPVRGRREKTGQLQAVRFSSQAELPPEWRLLDAQGGTAVYRPRALKVQELALTALGGTLRHDSDFVPPAAARHIVYGPLFDSLSVERWQHWTVLGRDVFAEVVYKGFLFPFGHRASLVKQTERVFLSPKGGGPVRAYLRQRMFIRVANRHKSFPAYGQPNGGRMFPAGVVGIQTETTPDLVDPTEDTKKTADDSNGSDYLPSPAGRLRPEEAGLMFWPRIARLEGADVIFDVQIQGAPTRAKLIFVDNVAANRADMMSWLATYYNKLASPDLDRKPNSAFTLEQPDLRKHPRTLDLRGETLRYCDEIRPGTTSHKTLCWTLKATGGVGGLPQNQWEGPVSQFDDPLLEGADQPPFFPAIETSRIRIDQVERLTGGAPQIALAQFEGWYVQNGFEVRKLTLEEDSLQIYLDIVNTVTMDMGGSGDRSGGVLRPSGHVIGLSRQRGPLTGNTPLPAGSIDTLTGGETGRFPLSPKASPPIQGLRGQAKMPAPDPAFAKQAFKTFFSDSGPMQTKILGLVTVGSLLKCLDITDATRELPHLQEALEYGLGGNDIGIEGLHSAVVQPLHKVVRALVDDWRKAGDRLKLSLPGVVTGMHDVFPDVDSALNDLLDALATTAGANNTELFASLSSIYECGRRLMDACSRVATNPLEYLQLAVQEKLADLTTQLGSFSAAFDTKIIERVQRIHGDLVSVDLQAPLVAAIVAPLGAAQTKLQELEDGLDKDKEAFAAIEQSMQDLQATAGSLAGILRSDIIAAIAPTTTKGELRKPAQQQALDIVDKGLATVDQALGKARTRLEELSLGKPGSAETNIISGVSYLKQAQEQIAAARDELRNTAALARASYGKTVAYLARLLAVGDALFRLRADTAGLVVRVPQTLHEFLLLWLGPRLPKLPPPDQARTFIRKLMHPVQDGAKGVIDGIADTAAAEPQPTLPPKDGKFQIPTDWKAPGENHSLVNAMLQIARTVEKHVADPALPDTARQPLARLGHDALEAQIQLHRAAVGMALAIRGLDDFIETHIQESLQKIDAAFHSLERVGVAADASLRTIVDDFASVDISAKVREHLESPILALCERTLRWFQGINSTLLTALEQQATQDAVWKELLAPWIRLAQTYDQKIRDVVQLARHHPSEWLAKPHNLIPELPVPEGAMTATGAQAVTAMQRLLADQVAALRASLAEPGEQAVAALMAAFAPVLPLYEANYSALAKKRASAFTKAAETPATLVLPALLVKVDSTVVFSPNIALTKENTDASQPDRDQLHWDLVSLQALLNYGGAPIPAQHRAQAMRFLAYLSQGWSNGQSTPLRILNQMQRIALEEVRAKLVGLFNFSAIREEIEERIKLLIPSAATLSYDFRTTIQAGASEIPPKVFQPKEGCALTVRTRSRIDLRALAPPTFESVGELGAFDIQLFSDFDAITIHFKGIRFTSTGGATTCDLQYGGFTLGAKLNYLAQLTPLFGSPAGSGFYLKPMNTGIGLETGYKLNLGMVTIGNLAIFNVSLNAAARLPFDNQKATFIASLSRRDSPFTIAIAPYGGSGFFLLEADTQGIVSFEASFEYGGAGAFSYGPLQGHGRLMVGAYIRSTRTSTEIYATFYVGGSASIWIFNFGASLYVNATQQDGKMVGSATYAFSFSMGIVDYDYQVTVDVKLKFDGSSAEEDEKAKSQSTPLGMESIRLASLDTSGMPIETVSDSPAHPLSLARAKPILEPPAPARAQRRIDTRCQTLDWAAYSRYFDLSMGSRLEDF
ncbi:MULTISPECIES: hypothetical protein [Achromobacter]|uniref:hypothetical protein n=1 Tax=Achromobacter TaxID=222 RepID=UPI0025BBF914|nr:MULTISPECIES: hypothetical protein [Achromobacter]